MDLARLIDRHAEFRGRHTAIQFENEIITYAELARRIGQTAAALHDGLKVKRGDRVAFLGVNDPELLVLLFACARLGAIFVPLNFRLAPPEHRYVVHDCDARVLIAQDQFHPHCEQFRADLPGTRFVSLGGEAPAGWDRWGSLVASANPGCDAYGRADDPLLVVYTSGTTGFPKGAVLNQDSLRWNAFNSWHMHDMTGEDHVLTNLPMFHVGGLNIQTTPALLAGATVTLHARFDAERWLVDVARRRPTLSLMVPATMNAVIEHPEFVRTDLSSLRFLQSGSSLVPEHLTRALHARGIAVGQVYGSSETCPIASYTRREQALAKVGSAGLAALHGELRVVKGNGREAAPGEVGEVQVRGPQVMREYWNRPDATREAMVDGWFRSGDLGSRDADGFLRIVGRAKDVIISGGENIYPAELELVIAAVPGVAEVAVAGVADPQWGEIPVAFVLRDRGSDCDAGRILAALEGRVARFKLPRRVLFVEDLPRNVMGKVQKFALSKMLEESQT